MFPVFPVALYTTHIQTKTNNLANPKPQQIPQKTLSIFPSHILSLRYFKAFPLLLLPQLNPRWWRLYLCCLTIEDRVPALPTTLHSFENVCGKTLGRRRLCGTRFLAALWDMDGQTDGLLPEIFYSIPLDFPSDWFSLWRNRRAEGKCGTTT